MSELELTESKSAMAFIVTLGVRQSSDMLRFFDRKDNYLLVGRDADAVAVSYFKSSSCLKHVGHGADRQPYLTINKKMAAEVIRAALVEQRCRIEVYVHEHGNWALERKGSPGNLQAFEEEMSHGAAGREALDSAIIAAVRLGRIGGDGTRLVGCCFVDCCARMLRNAEFVDDESLSTLESLMCQQGACEVVIPVELVEADRARLKHVFDRCELKVTVGTRSSFKGKDSEQDLRRLLGVDELRGRCLATEQRLSLTAAGGLIKHLELMTASDSHGLWALEWTEPNHFMRLDAGALHALSVFPQSGESDRNASLQGILGKCQTAAGTRMLRKWLKQPLITTYDIELRLDLVQAFATSFQLRSMLRDAVLPSLSAELERICRKMQGPRGDLQDVYVLYRWVHALPALLRALHTAEGCTEQEAELLSSRFVAPLERAFGHFLKLLQLVEKAVDLEAVTRHEYLLQPHFDPELVALHESKEELVGRIKAEHKRLVEELGLDDRLKLELSAQHGYVLRVTRKDEVYLRNIEGLQMLQTKKEGILFRTNSLESLSADYRGVSAEYNVQQKGLVARVMETALTFVPLVHEAQDLIAELDVLLTFAQVSVSAPEPFVRPTIVDVDEARQRIELHGCRHPCVERMDGVNFIKNDVELVQGESTLQIVTGPNMGGKSTYIRAVGVNVLLAQVGCFVACDAAWISPADAILARVGAGDVQSRGVSTFMAEMLESASILKNASNRSLVIIDELGRGTSTHDGYGLAHALCTHLAAEIRCLALFATHFHELTALADVYPTVRNRHVAALVDGKELTMIYKVRDGAADQSFGVHIATASKFPRSIIAAAKRKLKQLEGGNEAKEPIVGQAPVTEAPAMNRQLKTLKEHELGISEVRKSLGDFVAMPIGAPEELATTLRGLQTTLRATNNACMQTTCTLVML
tara:strand:+ start:150 stop:2930 length:2781 start_codon:yes stop_codon:yes gene_type:complete